jgi:hypothetical protein
MNDHIANTSRVQATGRIFPDLRRDVAHTWKQAISRLASGLFPMRDLVTQRAACPSSRDYAITTP